MTDDSPTARDPFLSVVLPVYNERGNLERVLGEIETVCRSLERPFEILVVDDGSEDGSREWLEARVIDGGPLRVLLFERNYGQAAALDAGLAHARGEVVATLDADGQNDPHDLLRMLPELERGADLVTGWRRDRKDLLLRRRLPSRLANALICGVLRLPIHDLGCTLRIYRRPVAQRLHLERGLHRFIVPLASAGGATIAEIEVNHRERFSGETKYGLSRVFPVLRDFLRVARMTWDPSRLPRRPDPTPYRIAGKLNF